MTNKERQDIELCAQKATLQQQRSHIEILESALNRAQLHINQVEDQVFRFKFDMITDLELFFFCLFVYGHSIDGSAVKKSSIRNHRVICPPAMCKMRMLLPKVLKEKWPTWKSGFN